MASIQPGRAPAGRHRRRERQDHCINMRSFPAPQRAHLPHIARHVRHGEPWRGRVPHRRATSGGFWQTSHIGPVRRPASGSRRSNHAQPRRLPCLMRWVKRVGCRGRLVYHEFACGLCREDKGRHTDEGGAGRRSSVYGGRPCRNPSASPKIPSGYHPLPGSERSAAPDAELIGPAPAADPVHVTVVLRRRPDGPAVPDPSYYLNTPPSQRRPPKGASSRSGTGPPRTTLPGCATSPAVTTLRSPTSTRRAGRSELTGTVEQFSRAFGVALNQYRRPGAAGRREPERPRARRSTGAGRGSSAFRPSWRTRSSACSGSTTGRSPSATTATRRRRPGHVAQVTGSTTSRRTSRPGRRSGSSPKPGI